jgi:AcrR family transcriptional regulator
MAQVAEEAEVATATVYRHFTSVDEILSEYRLGVGLRLLEFSQRQSGRGVALLHRVCQEWIRLVVEHGSAMIHTRSDQGYLGRLRGGSRHLTVQAAALAHPVGEACRELGFPDAGDEALFLWNLFFDPREIVDVLTSLGLSQAATSEQLLRTYLSALKTWARHKGNLC